MFTHSLSEIITSHRIITMRSLTVRVKIKRLENIFRRQKPDTWQKITKKVKK